MGDGNENEPSNRDLGSILRGIAVSIVAGTATGSGVAATKLIESRFAIVGLGMLVLTATFQLTVGIPTPQRPTERGRRKRKQFHEWRDADVVDRNDEAAKESYRQLRAEAYRLYRAGRLTTYEAFRDVKERALDAIINTESRRIEHACNGPVTLVVVEDRGDEFEARRTSYSSLGHRIRRGMHCPHDAPIDTILDRYASYHEKCEFYACGRTYFLCALSNVADVKRPIARALLGSAANEYEGTYLHLRWMAPAPPQTGTSSGEAQ